MGREVTLLGESSKIDTSDEARAVMRELRPKPETIKDWQRRQRLAVGLVATGMNAFIVD